MFWNYNIFVSILSYSLGHIDCMINSLFHPFFFTGFYDCPALHKRHISWNLLHKIASTHSNPQLGCIVGGDFNKILYDHEKRGGIPKTFNQMNYFRTSLAQHSLTNLHSSGSCFTWEYKRRHPFNILECLDRFVVTPTWRNTFPNFSSKNLEFYGSDHRPVLINTAPILLNQ